MKACCLESNFELSVWLEGAVARLQWRLWRGIRLVALIGLCVLASDVVAGCTPDLSRMNRAGSSAASERALERVPAHISEFNPVAEPLALPRCGSVRPPEALLTPDPLLPAEDDDSPVRVSFIVGADGHVHSAFVLNGAGPQEDEAVLRAVRNWRYRPALCNGVPTDSEAQVRFIIH